MRMTFFINGGGSSVSAVVGSAGGPVSDDAADEARGSSVPIRGCSSFLSSLFIFGITRRAVAGEEKMANLREELARCQLGTQ